MLAPPLGENAIILAVPFLFNGLVTMSAPEFDIIFRGDIVFGHQLAEVKLKLQQLFKADAAKIDALFTGRPVPLKRNLDEATATKYRDALIKAGAAVELCSSDKSPANAPSKPAPQVAAARPAPVAPAVVSPRPVASPPAVASSPVVGVPVAASPQWSIAPAGSDLLSASERAPEVPPLKVNLAGISLREQTGNLVDASELPAEPVARVVVPMLDVAEAGSNLSDSDERLALPQVEIELDWEIAEVGSDLLSESERSVVVPVVVGPVDFGLAPAGSDLGQLKPSVKPVTPDISGLSLSENP